MFQLVYGITYSTTKSNGRKWLQLLFCIGLFVTTIPSFASKIPQSITSKVTVGETQADVTLERASDKELRAVRPSNYRQSALQRTADAVGGPFIKVGKFVGVKLPAESVPFYAAMYLHRLSFCDYEANPSCLSEFWDSLKDPIGHLGFAAFIAVSETTGKYLQRAMLATENLRNGYSAVGQRSLGRKSRTRARVRARILTGTQVGLSTMLKTLPMTFGMLASSLVEEIAHDQDLINCASSLFKDKGYKKDPNVKKAIDRICDKAYDHWVSSRKVWSYAPMLVSMLAAQFTSHYAQRVVGKAINSIAAQVAKKKSKDLARTIVTNGIVAVLPGGAVRTVVGVGLKISNLFLFFALNEEVYAKVIARPWNKRVKGRELMDLLDGIHRKMDQVDKNGSYADLYSTPGLCNDEERARLQKTFDEDPLSVGYQIRHPGKDCDLPEMKFVREARTVSERLTEWRQFINENFLVSFQSWQSQVTDFVSTYETSFTFYDEFLKSYKVVEETIRAEGMDPDSDEGEEIRKQALINPYSSPTVLIDDDWQKHLGPAIQMIEDWLKEQPVFRNNQKLLTEVLFISANETPMTDEDTKKMFSQESSQVGIRENDYISIRNYLVAAQSDFPLEKFYPKRSYEYQQLQAAKGEKREILASQLRYKLVTSAIRLMDSWLSYDTSNFKGLTGARTYAESLKSDELKRAQESDKTAQELGVPKTSDLIDRSKQIRVLGKNYFLVRLRDTLKLPVFLPTGYLGRQNYLLGLKSLQISEKSIAHPKKTHSASTPGPVEHFFASMACGPQVSGNISVNGQTINYQKIRQDVTDKLKSELAQLKDTEDTQARIEIIKRFKQEIYERTQDLISNVGDEAIESPLIVDDAGYKLQFKPPRIMSTPSEISRLNRKRVPRRIDTEGIGGVCQGPGGIYGFDIYRSEWVNGDTGRKYFGMPELIEDNLMWSLVRDSIKDPFEEEEVMKFYSWWEENAELPMFVAFHRFNTTYKNLIEKEFLPALLSNKRHGQSVGATTNRFCNRPKNKNKPRCKTSKKFAYDYQPHQGIAEGIKNSILSELTFLMRILEQNHQNLPQDKKDPTSNTMDTFKKERAKTMMLFHNYLGSLAKFHGTYFEKKEVLQKTSRELKNQISSLAKQAGDLTVQLQWQPDWANDRYTAELAQAVREDGIVQLPENKKPEHYVLRHVIFRLIELEEELSGYGQMLTFMPNEYASVRAEAAANLEAGDF